MELITISFTNVSHMAHLIINCRLFDFVPDWPNASRTDCIGDSHLKKHSKNTMPRHCKEKEAVTQNECCYQNYKTSKRKAYLSGWPN